MAQTPIPVAQLTRRRLLRFAALMGISPFSMGTALALGGFEPNRPVRLIIPQAAGGAADRLARLLAEHLGARWKQPVVIDYKPGGGVVNGTLAMARSAPDGHTLALLGSSLSVNAAQRKDLPYDTFKDLHPITRVGYYTVGLVANAAFPADDLKGLIALARARPGKLSFGSNGIGTSAQMAGELLNQMAGIKLQHIPYNGASKMYIDMLGSQIPLGFSVVSSADSFIKSGKLKVIGVTSLQRSKVHPNWPTIAESFPGYEAVNWAGFVAPAGLPKGLDAQINADIMAVLGKPEIARMLVEMGIDFSPQGPTEFTDYITAEVSRFAAVSKSLGTKLE